MPRISDETNLEHEILSIINQDKDESLGILSGAVFQKIVEKFWDFDQNDFHTTLGYLFAHELVRFVSNESRGLVLTPKGNERVAQHPVIIR